MMGLLKSSVFMPVARHKDLAPAILRPCVVVLLRNCLLAISISSISIQDQLHDAMVLVEVT